MEVTYLGQGFEPESKNAVGNKIKVLLEDNRYDSFFCISAFASVTAIDFLGQIIKDNSFRTNEKYTVIVGIDQDGTSKEALTALNSLEINSYVFYQTEPPIFHPKIYLFEGQKDTVLIIGSSNLTGAGLFNNVESSLMIEFTSSDEKGKALVNQVKSYFSTLFDFSDPNLFKLDLDLIESLVNDGYVPTTQIWTKRYKKYAPQSDSKESTPSIVIPSRKTAKIPRAFKGKYKTDKVVSELIVETENKQNLELVGNSEYKVLWSVSNLRRRDLNIPTGESTHETGSMTLRKGNMEEIDQRHYFYDVVFADLNWEQIPRTPNKVSAYSNFRIVICGVDYGTYKLKITHNTDTNTKTYRQNNAMSHLHWEEAKELVKQEELLDKSLYILKNINTSEFVIEIK